MSRKCIEAMKTILVIDAQGGGMGAQLIKQLSPALPQDCKLLAVGTNVLATNAMIKAGAQKGASGENAIVYNASRADLILGPIGIMLVNGIMGEVSEKMAVAVSMSKAEKILIPSSACGVTVTGARNMKLDEHIKEAVEMVAQWAKR